MPIRMLNHAVSLTSLPTTPTRLLPDVYPFAAFLAQRFGCKSIIGIGELTAPKLIEFHPEFDVIGVVHVENLRRHRQQYEFGTWLGWDESGIPLPDHILGCALIVCSNVIDQLQRPGDLFGILKSWMDIAPVCILTATEKDLNQADDLGRWSLSDLERLLRAEGFQVDFIGLTASDDVSYEKKTVLAVITNNRTVTPGKCKTPSDFRVVAFMAAYNEEDIIVHSIKKWTDQGVEVHVLENWLNRRHLRFGKAIGSAAACYGRKIPCRWAIRALQLG